MPILWAGQGIRHSAATTGTYSGLFVRDSKDIGVWGASFEVPQFQKTLPVTNEIRSGRLQFEINAPTLAGGIAKRALLLC